MSVAAPAGGRERAGGALLLQALLAACACLPPAAVVVLSSSRGLKWVAAAVVVLGALFVLSLASERRLAGILLLAASLPIGLQYGLWTHGNRHFILQHYGGAPAEPVINLIDLPILFLILLGVVEMGLGRVRLPRWTVFDSLVVLFLLLSAASAFNSTEPLLLVFEMARYLKYLALYWVLRAWVGRPGVLRGVVVVSLAMAALQGGVAAAQYFGSLELPLAVGGVGESSFESYGDEVIQRVTGLLGHPNTFAAWLVPMIGWGLVVLIARIRVRRRLLALPSILLATLALVLTFSRNGYLALLVTVLGIAGIALRTRRLPWTIVPVCLGAALLAILLVFGFGLDTGTLRGMHLVDPTPASGLLDTVATRLLYDPGKALESRGDLLRIAGRMVAAHPVLGIGLNSFEETMAAYDRTGTVNVIQQPVHNIVALVAAETGLPAALLFVILGAILLRTSWRLLSSASERAFVTGLLGLGTLGALAFMNLFDVTIRKEPIVGLVTLVAALVLAAAERERDAVEGCLEDARL